MTEASGRRILIVDDDIDVARLLAMLLRQSHHVVEVVHDGPAALESVRANPPEIVLLDLGLRGMDGCEVARRMRALAGMEKTLLIALTGHGHEGVRKQVLDAGFNLHILKPATLDTLEEAFIAKPSQSGL